MLPSPVFVGFFPKKTLARPAGLERFGVREVCSVSGCLSPGPEGWMAAWKHNDLGFFDSEADALSVVPADDGACDVYAYELFPLRAVGGEIEPMEVRAAPGAVPEGYRLLGYDVATRSASDFFECSPLSCNHAAERFPVNGCCLVDELSPAGEALRRIAADGGYEPGPYHLLAVHRRPRAAEEAR